MPDATRITGTGKTVVLLASSRGRRWEPSRWRDTSPPQ